MVMIWSNVTDVEEPSSQESFNYTSKYVGKPSLIPTLDSQKTNHQDKRLSIRLRTAQ
jgi:hypothetical protein